MQLFKPNPPNAVMHCVCDTVMRVDAVTSSYCVDYYRFYIYISIMYISSRVN